MPAICKRSMSVDAKFTTCPVLVVANVSVSDSRSHKPLSTRQFAAAFPSPSVKEVHVMERYYIATEA